MPQIKTVLVELNPWWKGPFDPEYKERAIYARLGKFLPLRPIIALTGLRRVGKTTLLLKAAADAIAGGLDPRRVIYFSFDEFKSVEVREVLRTAEDVLDMGSAGGPALLLLDEVQKLDDWESQAKALYDANPKLKLMISGSESLFIRRKSKAALAGRMFEFRVEPLTFREFLTFKGENKLHPELHSRELSRLFREYMKTQGFPELVGVHDKDVIRKYIKESIVDKVVYRDIPHLVRIKQAATLDGLLGILMDDPGQMIDLASLGGDLKITRQTLALYLRYLEDSFLIRKLYNYSRNRRKVERKLKKIYPIIASPALLFQDDDHSLSRAFECTAVNQLRAEFFWRDPYKNEVDVVRDGRPPLPIEIKSGRVDFAGVEAFMRKFKVKEAVVISRDKDFVHRSNGRTVAVIPAYRYFLTAGSNADTD